MSSIFQYYNADAQVVGRHNSLQRGTFEDGGIKGDILQYGDKWVLMSYSGHITPLMRPEEVKKSGIKLSLNL